MADLAAHRKTILQAIEAHIRTVATLTEERTHIGFLHVDKVMRGGLWVWIEPQGDHGEVIDCEEVDRELQILIAVVTKVDEGSTQEEVLQMDAAAERVQHAMEQLIENNTTGVTFDVKELPPGWQWGSIDDHDTLAFIGCGFTVTYQRELAPTP